MLHIARQIKIVKQIKVHHFLKIQVYNSLLAKAAIDKLVTLLQN